MGTGVWSTVREGTGRGAGQSTRTPEGTGRGAGQSTRTREGTGRGGGAEHAHSERAWARGRETRYKCDIGALHAYGAHVVVSP